MGEMDVGDKECQSPFMRDPHQDGICFSVVSFLPKPTLSALSGKKKYRMSRSDNETSPFFK